MASKGEDGKSLNRATGLLVIEVRHSNPNGDPDAESDPRTTDSDGRGLISPVSLKRKLRDLVEKNEGPAWTEADATLKLTNDGRRYQILESRDRNRERIFAMDAKTFSDEFWDARIFGNTFLEDIKTKGFKPGEKDHFISTGVVQLGAGVSVAPIEVERMTTTNKAGVEKGKDRGMAPLGWRVVRHGLYAMPFFVNPMMAAKSGCSRLDIELLKFLIPYAYSSTASASRPFVEIRHAWYTEHKSPLGSCPDHLIIDNLTPKKVKGSPDTPSTSIDEYEVPTELPDEVKKRLLPVVDLCLIEWT